MTGLSLRLRILLTTSAIVIGTISLIIASLGWVTQAAISDAAMGASERTNATLAAAFESTEKSLSTEATLLADRPGTRSLYQADFATISDNLQDITAQLEIDWAAMVDSDGLVIGSSSGSGFSESDQLPFTGRLDRARAGLSSSGLELSATGPVLLAIKPVKIGGYVQSILILAKKVDRAFLAKVETSAGVNIAVVDNDGRVISSFHRETEHLRVNRLTTTEIGGERYIAWPTQIDRTADFQGIQFISFMPEGEVTKPFKPLQGALFVVLAVGLLISIISGLFMAKSVTDPLDTVVTAAKVLQAGEWPEPFKSPRRDEIGLLQLVFDEMTSSMKASHEKLLSMLQVDPLTDLFNYRGFRERLDQSISASRQDSSPLSLIKLNLDGFEAFNRENGAEAGDSLLREFADYFLNFCGEGEFAGRLGGDEFILAMRRFDASQEAEALRRGVEEQFPITASIGYCALVHPITSSELMLLAANMAVSQAKNAGRNRVRAFEGFSEAVDPDNLKQFLQQGSYSAVRALAEAVDAKDVYTRGHSQRVAEYARDLAQHVGYDAGFVELVFVTGTLHDVGKIGVPDRALKKPGHLDEEEFAMIKLHPELGEKIVSQIPALRDTLAGIRCHHERYDGNGYPDGLAGEDIPLIGRILSVADTYDAMTSDRPYRKGLPVEVALAEIEKGKGTQFDPFLATVFVEMMRGNVTAAA